jgi:5-formyltetrahydrofolate cyclo-ligase
VHTPIQEAKRSLRRKMRAWLGDVTAQQRASASEKACAVLRQQPAWQQAKTLLLFAPLPHELDVWPLVLQAIAKGKTVTLPAFSPQEATYIARQVRHLDADLVIGKFGIREPSPKCPELSLNRLDFALMPGVAFDLHGCRLGRGKGFYDQLLAGVRGIRCGVAFDEQIVDDVPNEPHDLHVNCILTPTRWIQL